MIKKEILKKLFKEIEILKNKKYGFLNAGIPKYKRLFGRDSLISAWQLFNIDHRIAKNTLIKILARYQRKKIDPERDEEPGKILHKHQIRKKFHFKKLDFYLNFIEFL